MATTETVASRVRRAQAGDRAAFSTLIEESWSRLVALARSIVGEIEAEDAVQDSLIVAWRRLPRLRRPDSYPAWISRIVVHDCLKRNRRRPPSEPLSLAADVSAAIPAADTRLADTLEIERVLAALAPRQRAVMHLTIVDELSDREIAALMGITSASVRSHRRRARQRATQLLNGASSR